jgi:uncharacterized protein (DUF1330 family)
LKKENNLLSVRMRFRRVRDGIVKSLLLLFFRKEDFLVFSHCLPDLITSQRNPMPAYVIFIRDRITDQSEMDRYAVAARAARGEHPITPLVFYGAAESLEGPPTDGVVILAFPDMQAARAWYHSPAYQAARAHRLKGAEYRVILAEGLSPAP